MEKEKILFGLNTPLKINLVEITDTYKEWHKELKIIYVMKGSISLGLNNLNLELNENDFFIINSYEFIGIVPFNSNNAIILEFLIDNVELSRFYNGFSNLNFKCYSIDKNIKIEKYDYIRKILFNFISISLENRTEKELLIIQNTINLILFLINNFKYDEVTKEKNSSNKKRLIKILGFIEENYDNDLLSIEEISEYVELSPHYTLKVFRENLNLGLMDYLNALRIRKSINDLLYSDKNILEIAIDNGFTNARSYHRVFKNVYGTSPKNYKNQNQNIQPSTNYVLQKKELLLELINKHIIKDYNNEKLNKIESNIIDIDMKISSKSKVSDSWKKIISIGKAIEGLKGDIQYQLKELKKDINPKFVKFNGIFNDEMNAYREDSNGQIFYDYSYIDKLIDFLISIDLKPYINIGFMPNKLASKSQYILDSNVNTSFPKDIKLWTNLIYSFFNHLIDRYGEQEVFSWYFEIWNNPNHTNTYWHESDEKFFFFFEETFKAIKKVSKEFKVGSPSITWIDGLWAEKFLIFLKEKTLNLDFFSFENYSVNIKNVYKNNTVDYKNILIDFNSDIKNIKIFCSKLKQNFNNKPEFIISEWNISPFPNFFYDTCYQSSHIVQTILNESNFFDGFIYWTCTENRIKTDIFYGGLGLFTTNNLKKSSYNSFMLLSRLGNELVSKGKNYIVTTNKNSVQLILYNHNENLIFNKEDYLSKKDLKNFQLNIKNLENSTYLVTKYYLNSSSGSIYDTWVEIGSPKKINTEIFEYLKSKEKMKISVEEKKVNDTLILEEILDSNSVVLIDIKKLNSIF